jgi:hypothetical protein
MLNAKAHDVARAVKDYGVIALMDKALTPTDVANIATKCIGELHRENTSLMTILSSGKHLDDSFESVTFEVEATTLPTVSRLVRVIAYKQIPGMSERRPDRERGPLVPAAKAQALCEVLNS